MACCGAQGSGEAERALPFPVALVLLTVSAILSLAAILALGVASTLSREARVHLRPFTTGALAFLGAAGNRMLARPFLVSGPVRCRITGRMYPFSETLAGMLYRYFNLFLLGSIAVAATGFFLGLRHISGG